MRRFELIKGNKANFWEIERKGEVVTTYSGRIGKGARAKEERHDDEMAAEVSYDRLVHLRRNKGYVEVDEPSEPLGPIAPHGVVLTPLDGSEPLEFSRDAMEFLLSRMVDVLIMDRQREAPSVERWYYRATRKLGLETRPAADHPRFDEWTRMFLKLSAKERAVPFTGAMVGTFKLTDPNHWIVTAKEAEMLGRECANRRPRRGTIKASQQAWLDAWVSFNDRVAEGQGYEVVPAP